MSIDNDNHLMGALTVLYSMPNAHVLSSPSPGFSKSMTMVK
jgi:hypothetical protein